jgi:hypothetical protein
MNVSSELYKSLGLPARKVKSFTESPRYGYLKYTAALF